MDQLVLVIATAVTFVGSVGVGFWMLVWPHVASQIDGPKPIELNSSMSGFMCRISAGGSSDTDTLLLCDPHALILKVPRLVGRTEHHIPLGDLVAIRIVGQGLGQTLEFQTPDEMIDVLASGHPKSSLELLIERILAAAAGAEKLTAPRELLDLISDP